MKKSSDNVAGTVDQRDTGISSSVKKNDLPPYGVLGAKSMSEKATQVDKKILVHDIGMNSDVGSPIKPKNITEELNLQIDVSKSGNLKSKALDYELVRTSPTKKK